MLYSCFSRKQLAKIWSEKLVDVFRTSFPNFRAFLNFYHHQLSSRKFFSLCLTLIDLGVFATFQNFKSLISPKLRVPKKRTIACLKGIGLWSGEPLSPHAPSFRTFQKFLFPVAPLRGSSAHRGACRNNRILGFAAQRLVVEGYVVGFFDWSKTFVLRKLDFAKNRISENSNLFRAKNTFFSALETYSIF